MGVTRKEMDESAVASHAKAVNATKNGEQVVHDTDEGIRPSTNMAGLSKLKDIKSRGKGKGMITAGLSSQICDGAAAILICNARGLKKLGIQPRARIRALAVCGSDPVQM